MQEKFPVLKDRNHQKKKELRFQDQKKKKKKAQNTHTHTHTPVHIIGMCQSSEHKENLLQAFKAEKRDHM